MYEKVVKKCDEEMLRGAGKAIMRGKAICIFFFLRGEKKRDSSSYFEREKEKKYLTENPLILELKYEKFPKYLIRKCWKSEVNVDLLQISKAK